MGKRGKITVKIMATATTATIPKAAIACMLSFCLHFSLAAGAEAATLLGFLCLILFFAISSLPKGAG
jgi:hypothetical protein